MSENNKETLKWYYKPVSVAIALLAAGPFALPLVWFNPKFGKWLKILLTVVVALITLWLVRATVDIYKNLLKQMAELQSILR